MPRRILIASLLVLSGLLATSSPVRAEHRHDPHDHIRQQADSLVGHTRDLYYEIRSHHRGEGVSRMLSQVLNLHRSARRMSGYAAAHSPVNTLEREMTRMEDAYHDLEHLLRGLSHHHGGHDHGSHRHVRELMRCVDGLVHHIHDDIHQLEDRRYLGRHPSGPVHIAPAPTGRGPAPRDWNVGIGGVTFRLGR
jgi:hypothetical protein